MALYLVNIITKLGIMKSILIYFYNKLPYMTKSIINKHTLNGLKKADVIDTLRI